MWGVEEKAAWAKGQCEPSPVHAGGWGQEENRRGQKKTGFSMWLGKKVWPCGQMEALGYGGEACQQTRSVSCLQTGRGPALRWAGNRNQWGAVRVTLFLCGFYVVKWRSFLCGILGVCLHAVFSFDSSCYAWWCSIHRGHAAVLSQTYINQEPLFRLQSIAAMWIETLRPQVNSVGLCFTNVCVQGEQEEVGQGQFFLFP